MRWHRVRSLNFETVKQKHVQHDITSLQRCYWLHAGKLEHRISLKQKARVGLRSGGIIKLNVKIR